MSNIIAGILTLLFGALGDIISRVIWFKCSTDKIWTLLFIMPPFSIVSAIMYFMGKIQSAPLSCGSIFDVFLILIPVVIIVLSKLLPKIIDDDDGESLIYKITFISIATTVFALARIYKYYQACNKMDQQSKTGSVLVNGILRSMAANFGVLAFNWLASTSFLQLIPIVGTPFTLWSALGEFSPGLQHAIPLTMIHFILNIGENSDDFIKSICEKK